MMQLTDIHCKGGEQVAKVGGGGSDRLTVYCDNS